MRHTNFLVTLFFHVNTISAVKLSSLLYSRSRVTYSCAKWFLKTVTYSGCMASTIQQIYFGSRLFVHIVSFDKQYFEWKQRFTKVFSNQKIFISFVFHCYLFDFSLLFFWRFCFFYKSKILVSLLSMISHCFFVLT